MASLTLFNRDQQRNPQRSGTDLHQFGCHECGRSMVDRGYWNGSIGERVPQYRCITPRCAQSTFKAINSARTTFVACGFI